MRRPHAPIPIVAHYRTTLAPAVAARLEVVAAQLLREDPRLGVIAPFGEGLRCGHAPCASLVIEDHSWIILFETEGDVSYGYRACLLAGTGDLVVISTPACTAFEDYCRQTLGLGDFEVVSRRATRDGAPLALRCARDETLLERLAARAAAGGGLNVVPYMGTGGLWLLAGRISARTRAPVTVAAPPPRLTRAVNDKIWFARAVKAALGARAQPRSFAAYGLAAVVAEAAILARNGGAIAVKIPASASSAGNIVLDAESLVDRSPRGCKELIDTRLRRAGWRGGYPLQVTSWETPFLASPSAQLWIPLPADGEVVVEGIFDQALTGKSLEFCGAAPTALPEVLQQRMADEAAMLGTLFQRLGYFGRCSLDSIVVGRELAEAEVHWVECNGRWGGTSFPMTLANRLIGDWSKAGFLVVERNDAQAPGLPFAQFQYRFAEELYRRGGPPQGAVVLSPNRIESGTGYEMLVLGKTQADARQRADALATALSAEDANQVVTMDTLSF